MCHKQKYVYNKYINKSVLVPCGKCPECQQAKANAKAQKIRNHYQSSDCLCLFVTLTYKNKYIPYVKTSDLLDLDPFFTNVREIVVYRDKGISSNCRSVVTRFCSLDCVPWCDFVPQLRRKNGCTGVLVWSDVQKFIKRLRINLKRHLHYYEKISYIAVGEYGKTTYRPHFHLLIYFPKATLEEVRPIIVESWPFGDMLRKDKRIQLSIDASSYLASYLNKSANFPKILSSIAFRQKSSHSLYFGQGLSDFQLVKILEKVDRGDCSYSRKFIINGKPLLAYFPIPKYVINRYFPRFKGYSCFTDYEILQLLRFPKNLWDRLGHELSGCTIVHRLFSAGGFDFNRYIQVPGSFSSLLAPELLYSRSDFHRFVVRLSHACETYKKLTGKNVFDFAIDYCRVWRCRTHYINKRMYDDVTDFCSFYENASDYVNNPGIAPTLDPNQRYQLDPNQRTFVKLNDGRLYFKFKKAENIKEVVGYALAQSDYEF